MKKTERKRVQKHFKKVSLTKSEFKRECSVKGKLEKFKRTGLYGLNHNNEAFYGDFTKYQGFQEALDVVNTAQNLFNQIDPKVRDRFANNPQKLINFLQDESNREEAIKLGLIPKLDYNEEVPSPKPQVEGKQAPEKKVQEPKDEG